MHEILCGGRKLWDAVNVADSFFTRFRGLMGRKSMAAGEGLLITACNQVHTFNMRFEIDVIYLTKELRVIRVDTIPPARIGPFIKRAASVLEVQAGSAAKYGIKLNDEFTLV